ncbi:MAG: ATP-dependent zinc metalloprotease FtsH [Actinomycetota bacterium]|nr:ATP-dependent zinc metalloprotease FtsH [Actinomycetota bacterium]
MNRIIRSAGFYFLILILVLFMIQSFMGTQPKPTDLAFNDFTAKLTAGEIDTVLIKNKDKVIQGKLTDGKEFTVNYEENYNIAARLEEAGVSFKVDPQRESTWLLILINLLPFILIIGVWIFMINQMQGGGSRVMSFGKSRAKRLTQEHNKVTFKDVAGLDEAIEELQEIKEYLEAPGKFHAMGAKIPKGVLLFGPPGTGKTLLARAVAGEAEVPFFSISGSDFVEMFVGVGASRVRDLFEQAKAVSPSIIFMDEIDAVGRHRGAGLGGGHDEREQTLNQLLVEMDGFDVKDNVILIAATNRPDILDPALLRPGRFDRQIVVDRPDIRGREEILKVHAKGKPLTKDIDLSVLARRTPGFTGADLANMFNEAALLAARHNKKAIEMRELEEAIERVIAGPEKKTRIMGEKDKKIIAYHEAGHALVAHTLPNTDPVHKISIISRGRALGYTLTLPTDDKYLISGSELLDDMAMILGGRVAEEMLFGDVTTGAQNDLERVTKLARKMVCEYGMSKKLGPMALGQRQDQVFLGRDFASHPDYSPEIAYEIDKEIRRMIDESYKKAKEILTKHRKKLDKIAATLIEKETLEKEELLSLLEGKRLKKSSPKDKKDSKEDGGGPAKIKPKKGVIDIPAKLRPAES